MEADSGPYDSIQSICAGKNTWRVKVRVIRMWNVCAVNQITNPFSVQLVLLDAEGGKIEATIRKPLMKKFDGRIVEGEVYTIAFFHVVDNVGSYRATKHEFKLLFNSRTTISHGESAKISSFGCTLVNSEDIVNTKGECDYLLDVIGVLTGVYAEKSFVRHGKTSKVMVLELTDDKGVIKCSLFGDLVDIVNDYLATGGDVLPVVIFQLGRVKSYKGEISLQNVMNASNVLWDPQIPAAIEFRKRVSLLGIKDDVPVRVINTKDEMESIHDEFLRTFPRKSVKDLLLCEEDGVFIILGSVFNLCKDDPWWYMACTCYRAVAVNAEDGLYFCPNCNGHIVEATPRYKLTVDVGDADSSVTFVLFDTDCYRILRKSCRELLMETKDPSSGVYPELLDSIVGKELLFKVEKEADRGSRFGDPFKVKKICFDAHIMEKFKSCDSMITPESLKIRPTMSSLSATSDCALLLKGVIKGSSSTLECPKYTKIEPTTLEFGEESAKASVAADCVVDTVDNPNEGGSLMEDPNDITRNEYTQLELPTVHLQDDMDHNFAMLDSGHAEAESVGGRNSGRGKRIKFKSVKLER